METRLPIDALENIYQQDALEAELKLEERMVITGRDQIRKQIAEARISGNESGTQYGKALIAMSIDHMTKSINAFIAKAKSGRAGKRHIAVKYLEQADPEVAGFIAIRVIIDGLTGKKQLLQRAAIRIGRRIEDEVRFTAFSEDNRAAYNKALAKAKKGSMYHRKQATMAGYARRFSEAEAEWQAWSEQDTLHVGMALINMALETGLVEVGTEISSRKNTNKILEPTAKLVEWIEAETKRSEFLSPAALPMVVRPLRWTNPFNGGYLTKEAQARACLVKTGNQNYLTELADNADEMPMVYGAVNALQETAWRINPKAHAILTELWERGNDEAALPSREDIGYVPCPQCGQPITLAKANTRSSEEHVCFSEPEVLRQWKKDAYVSHAQNISLRSKRLHVAKTLKVADIFAASEAIYFPYQLDFRGRVYAIPSLNPQGNDMTKGLLEFAEGKPIEDGVAAGWLAIHGANVYGYDKASLEDRIDWVETNTQLIQEVADDPYSNRFWHEADKPWQFLSFCFEWAGFMEQGYGYVSRLPVALDGSCSGIQHFSAMLRDKVGGAAVNLTPQEVPSDIYQAVCDKVVEKLEADANQLGSTIAKAKPESPLPEKGGKAKAITEASALAKGWLSLQPTRKTTKRQVMTLPYGSTRYSCREYTEAWLKEVTGPNGHPLPWEASATFAATQYMSDIIWDSISEVVIAARQAMDWLQKCAKVVAKEELPVYWTTPSGFIVMQKYKNYTSRRVKTKLGEAVMKLSLMEEKKTIDKRRMANAISPNFVHSMDATHLVMSVCVAKDNGVDSFAMIHDSFGTHAADTNLLAACLREAFVDLYTEGDVLGDFRDQIRRQVSRDDTTKIPPLPAKGSLAIEDVRQSDFFFA